MKRCTSFHGETALVIDLARYLSIHKASNKDAKHIIMTRHSKELYGLLVDEVSQIIRVAASTIKETPDLIHEINHDYIRGVYTEDEERLILILNLDVILSEEELVALSDVKACQSKTNPIQ